MSPTLSALPEPDPADYYREVLHGLIELGAGLAREVYRAAEGGDAVTVADATIAFERVSRSVRRSVALARTLDAPVRAPLAAARRQVIRTVEDRIQARCGEDEGERLRAELAERLDGPELADEIGDRPIADVIEDICRDLGIAAPPGLRPWKRRVPAEVAVLHRLAAGMDAEVLLHPGRFRGK